MNRWRVLCVSILLLLVGTNAWAADLAVIWGLDGPVEYRERRATAEQNAAQNPPAAAGAETYRYFNMVEPDHSRAVLPLYDRTMALYQLHRDRGGAPTMSAFAAFVREKDHFLADSLQRVAPRLYFDFIGENQTEYVLTGIIVDVLDYFEYRGGGFAQDEAWYDLVLTPEPGAYHYPIDRKLRFTGSGRAEIRFSSNNFYDNVGLSPIGAYMINLVFEFLADGKRVTVETGAFKIDV